MCRWCAAVWSERCAEWGGWQAACSSGDCQKFCLRWTCLCRAAQLTGPGHHSYSLLYHWWRCWRWRGRVQGVAYLHTVQWANEGRIRPMGRVFPGWNHCFKLLSLFRRCWLGDRRGFCGVYLYPQLNLEKLLIRRLSKQALSVCVCVCCWYDTVVLLIAKFFIVLLISSGVICLGGLLSCCINKDLS